MRLAIRTLVTLLSLGGAIAHAQDVTGGTTVDSSLPPTSVRVGGTVLEAGCTVIGAVRAGGRLVVSCTEGRARIFAREAGGPWTLVEERRASGEIATLFVAGDEAWALVGGAAVRLADLAEVPIDPAPPPAAETTPPGAPPVATVTEAPRPPPPMPPAASALGPPAHATVVRPEPSAEEPIPGATVLRFRGPHAVLSPGLPLVRGEHVELVPAEGTRHAPVIGTVSSVTEDATEVDIGFGEVVRVGDGVRRSRLATTASVLDPPEARRTISISGTLGLVFDAAGLGTLDDLELVWRSDLPFALRVRAFPFSALYVGHTTDRPEDGGALVGGGSVDAILDTRYFAIGVGIGFGQYTTRFASTPLAATSDQRVGFAVLPTLRVGPVDGLHFEATSNILAVIDEFRFGGLDGRVRIPLVPSFTLEVRGGGWPSGLGFAMLGLRMAAEGNGGPGTIFVTPMIGYAGIDTGNHGFRSGPVLGIGIEGRLGQ